MTGSQRRFLYFRAAGTYSEAVHYSADGRFLAVTFNMTVVVWDLASRQAPVGQFFASGYGPDSALSPDGSLIYVGTADPPKVTAYEVGTGRAVASAVVPGRLLQLSPDGTPLAAAGGNDIILLDAATLAEQGQLQGHVDTVESMQFSDDGRLVAAGSNDRTSIVWDVVTRQQREQLRGHGGRVWGVDFSPDNHTLYTAGLDGTLLTWDLRGERRWIPSPPILEPVTNATFALLASPTGDAVAYIGDSSVQFLDLATGHPGPLVTTGHAGWGAWDWRPDGRHFATIGEDGFVRVWDWRTGELVAKRSVAPGQVAGLDYTGDGEHLLVAARSGAIYSVDAETSEPVGTTLQLDLPVVAFVASYGRRAIALSGDEFALVDLTSGRVVRRGSTGFVPGWSDFSPDGRRVAVGGGLSGEVRLLDVDTGEWVGPLRIAHSGSAWFTAYSPDGATFVTAGRDGKVALWDGRTGAPLGAVLSAPPELVTDARYLRNGHTVLISSLDGIISRWDTRPQRAIEFACQIAGRNLTADE